MINSPGIDGTRAAALKWRTGRHNPQLVYAMAGPAASDDDALVAAFFAPEPAAAAIRAHNAEVTAGEEAMTELAALGQEIDRG